MKVTFVQYLTASKNQRTIKPVNCRFISLILQYLIIRKLHPNYIISVPEDYREHVDLERSPVNQKLKTFPEIPKKFHVINVKKNVPSSLERN